MPGMPRRCLLRIESGPGADPGLMPLMRSLNSREEIGGHSVTREALRSRGRYLDIGKPPQHTRICIGLTSNPQPTGPNQRGHLVSDLLSRLTRKGRSECRSVSTKRRSTP
ncbi:hypothetical protein J6590_076847 [Homalodisca vitripennis]|nr:hypothetical protein J6590_076847 [Homalodisca vitripennis]